MIGRGPGAAYAACCSVAFRKLASELFFERAFYRGPLNRPSTNCGKDDSPKRGTSFRNRNNSACSARLWRP
jgi:hypothetical protein